MEWSAPMTEFFDAHRPATAFDHDSTLVAAMELSGKSWQLGAVIPGVSRRPKTGVKARYMNEVMRVVDRWKAEAVRAGKTIGRIVVAYEAGRDGFWIARELTERGIEAHVMQPASIPVERKGRRAKTDRIDLDMLLRTLLAWLRGSLGCARWCAFPASRRKMRGGRVASATSWCASASGSRTRSRVCCA